MKNTVLIIVGIFAVASVGWGAPAIGSVEKLVGTATAKQIDDSVRELALGSEVYLNDTIATGPNSKVQLRFVDNSMVAQGEQGILHIDEYVYNPDERSENGSAFRALKGVFRIITDQITKLNPERFIVNTESGTIGIRGCDVGVDVSQKNEKVYIIGLGEADSVVVSLKKDPATGLAKDFVVVENTGVGVNISPDDGLSLFNFGDEDVDVLDLRTSPKFDAVESPSPQSRARAAAASKEEEKSSSADDEWDAPGSLVSEEGGTEQVDQQIEEFVSNNLSAELDSQNTQSTAAPQMPENRSVGDDDGDNSGPDPIVTTGPRNTLVTGAGANWSWGVWDQEVTTTYPNGSTDMSKRIGVDTSGNFLSASEYHQLLTAPPALLTASSSAGGAVIRDGNMTAAVTGSSDINVTVGNVVNSWVANVNLGGGGNSLIFTANGGFNGSGKMNGGLSSYSLTAFGSSYGTPASQVFDGNLVKNPGATAPITSADISGAVLEFQFNHANGPQVRGAGGSDF